ncbi:hypothetical protein ACUOFU_09650 [Microbacterium arabinogalactanolyticum]|uniref:hypothetical protein n=1 Tax=Microbacterium arabinogalactanolyticum TaxID=69365 RepID=UPI004044A3CF
MAGRPARAAASADARDDGGRRHLGFTRLARRGRVGAQLLSDTLDLTLATVLAPAFASQWRRPAQVGGDAVLLFVRGDEHEARAGRHRLIPGSAPHGGLPREEPLTPVPEQLPRGGRRRSPERRVFAGPLRGAPDVC